MDTSGAAWLNHTPRGAARAPALPPPPLLEASLVSLLAHTSSMANWLVSCFFRTGLAMLPSQALAFAGGLLAAAKVTAADAADDALANACCCWA